MAVIIYILIWMYIYLFMIFIFIWLLYLFEVRQTIIKTHRIRDWTSNCQSRNIIIVNLIIDCYTHHFSHLWIWHTTCYSIRICEDIDYIFSQKPTLVGEAETATFHEACNSISIKTEDEKGSHKNTFAYSVN